MDDFWFRPKTHGYGCLPIHWKGWVFSVGFVVAVMLGCLAIGAVMGNSWWAPVWSMSYAFALTAVFLVVARKKTNGPWRWR